MVHKCAEIILKSVFQQHTICSLLRKAFIKILKVFIKGFY